VANYVYHLPIGSKGQYVNHVPVLSQILGGWEVSGVTEFQRGLPLSAYASQ